MGAGHVADRVDLHKAEPPDHPEHIERPGGRRPEPGDIEPEPPRGAVVDAQRRGHRERAVRIMAQSFRDAKARVKGAGRFFVEIAWRNC